ncbi:hypothetical protein DUI87_10813 [Hirundo rustica rustica]|uniref:Uncharacterized protein n=1 Tax=Hirundo rustica rustica TaxID=333673 RepID=A0A3M0KJ53_HIRRU|nr:hypothetical protein DUI87_10813 [Hirundo rustica rustica]
MAMSKCALAKKNISLFSAEDHSVAEYSEFLLDRLAPALWPLKFPPFHNKWKNITWSNQVELALHMCMYKVFSSEFVYKALKFRSFVAFVKSTNLGVRGSLVAFIWRMEELSTDLQQTCTNLGDINWTEILNRMVLKTLPDEKKSPLSKLVQVRRPELDTAVEVWPHQCRLQGDGHCPGPADHTAGDPGQVAIGSLDHLGTHWLMFIAIDRHPKVLFLWADFQTLFPQPLALHGVVVVEWQDLALGLVKCHIIEFGLLIQPLQILLQSLPTLQQINTLTP